jgi:hypothetical protein
MGVPDHADTQNEGKEDEQKGDEAYKYEDVVAEESGGLTGEGSAPVEEQRKHEEKENEEKDKDPGNVVKAVNFPAYRIGPAPV